MKKTYFLMAIAILLELSGCGSSSDSNNNSSSGSVSGKAIDGYLESVWCVWIKMQTIIVMQVSL